jgi:hypothetical protein
MRGLGVRRRSIVAEAAPACTRPRADALLRLFAGRFARPGGASAGHATGLGWPRHRLAQPWGSTMKTMLFAAITFALAISGQAGAEDAAQPKMSKEQQEMMAAFERMGAVRAEHHQLEYFVGDWSAKSTMWMDPKAPPQVSEGKSHSEAIFGGRYIETKYDGNMMGQAFSGRGMMGYDNLGGRFFATWIDSMSTGFWLSYGSYDKASNSYTYRGSMDDPMAPKTKIPVRVVVRITDPSHYTFEWNETHKGKESKTMQIEYSKL